MEVYAINLVRRIDRRKHIVKQFARRLEFKLKVVPAIEAEHGALGLWNTIKYILQDLVSANQEYIIICEDDHKFTKHFEKDKLIKAINAAERLNADVLLGGVSWFTDVMQLTPELFWVEKFSGLQFTVIFRRFFSRILEADFSFADAADYKISELTDRKYVIFPFISTQKEFGYSDVTSKNNLKGRVEGIFNKSHKTLQLLDSVAQFYNVQSKINE